MKKEDPNYVPPTSVHAQQTVARLGNLAISGTEKRGRDDKMDEDAREPKRERIDDDSDAEEMEIEDEDESGTKDKAPSMLRFYLVCYSTSDVRFLRRCTSSSSTAVCQAIMHESTAGSYQ
jgi:hypothetical protein